MVREDIKKGWIFGVDNLEGVPYLECPYCQRKISGKKVIFASIDLDKCPDCGKDLHFGNVRDSDWMYMEQFYGDE